jgi:hypothetical protein
MTCDVRLKSIPNRAAMLRKEEAKVYNKNKYIMTKKIRINLFILVSLLVSCISVVSMTSCSKDDDDYDNNYAALFAKTDYFIDMLDEVYEHYDAFGSEATETSDGQFTVTPIGRLIIVKINSYATDITYTDVKEALENHYRSNRKVNEIYINTGGTITIDCRN